MVLHNISVAAPKIFLSIFTSLHPPMENRRAGGQRLWQAFYLQSRFQYSFINIYLPTPSYGK
jgi:hypothetical protein